MKKTTRTFNVFAVIAAAVGALAGFAPAAHAATAVAETGGVQYATLQEAVDAAQDGATVTLIDDVTLAGPTAKPVCIEGKLVTLELNGKTITNQDKIYAGNDWSLLSVGRGGSLVVNGEGTVRGKSNDCYALDLRYGGKAIINGGAFVGNITTVYVYEGDLIVNGGDFSIQQLSGSKGYQLMMNCLDRGYTAGTATITVNGGTFHGFDPSDNLAEGTGTSFLGDTATVIEDTSVTPATYTTSFPGVAEIDGVQYACLADAIQAVGQGGIITLIDDVPQAEGMTVPSGKNFTLDFAGHTYTLYGPGAGSPSTETNGFQLLRDSNITFKNGTINVAEDAPQRNIKRIIQNYANLTLENMQFHTENLGANEDYALSFNNGDVKFSGATSIHTSDPSVIAFDVCKFADYPSCSVTFANDFTGTVDGKIVYDSPDAATHKLVVEPGCKGSFASVEATPGSLEAAKDGVSVSGGTFATPLDPEYYADGCGPIVQEDGSLVVHQHNLQQFGETESTCVKQGHIAHFYCPYEGCGKFFADAAATQELARDQIMKPLASHTLARVAALEPTSATAGHKEHWKCTACDALFWDQGASKPAAPEDVVLPALGEPEPVTHEVTFVFGNGTTTVAKVEDGDAVTRPDDPTYEGWKFVGWFTTRNADGTLSDEYDFASPVTEDLTLYAGWIKQGVEQLPEEEDRTEALPSNDLPKTGDDSMLPIVALGAVGIAVVVVGVVMARKRK